jgi:penicillin amidase
VSRRTIVRAGLAAVLVAGVALAAAAVWFVRGGRPQRSGEANLPGLEAPVEIRFDEWGVPAVAASSALDAAAALGWLHANDRLFQMELTRRAATGRLAELFGRRALRHDRRVVRLGFRRALRELSAGIAPETRALLEAYARGVNAWLAERGGDLPPEFKLLRARFEPWRPDDSLGVLFVMARQLSPIMEPNEEELLRLLRAFGPERAKELAGDPGARLFDEIAELAAAQPEEKVPVAANAEAEGLGSNNWVVAPGRTAAGGALLANDPHLGIGLPNVWYQARLAAPDYDASGLTLAGAPGVVLGRGRELAWGCTNLYIDDVDLFVERLDATGTKVQRGETWVAIDEHRETIVSEGESEEVVVRATDRGAFLPAEPEEGLPARSVAWTGWQPADQIAAFVALARAPAGADVRALVASYSFPAQNLVVATADGTIAWTPLGRGPNRFGWDGRFPVPAWRAEVGWQGLLPAEENPVSIRPEPEAIATANSLLPVERPAWFGEDFDTPHRLERIRARLGERRDWTPETLLELQGDFVSLWARELVAALGDAPAVRYENDAAKAAAALRAWDGAMATHGPSALFVLFERELQKRTFEDEAEAKGVARFGTRKRMSALLAGRLSAQFWDDVSTQAVEARAEIFGAALGAAWREGVKRWGEGSIHRLQLDHPLGTVPILGTRWNRGPFELPGSATTILAFGGPWLGDAMDVSYGPSMRFVTDAADPERTLVALPGGQSGHPFDPHYADRLESYLAGAAQPAPWSNEAVERAAVSRLRLVPAAATRN